MTDETKKPEEAKPAPAVAEATPAEAKPAEATPAKVEPEVKPEAKPEAKPAEPTALLAEPPKPAAGAAEPAKEPSKDAKASNAPPQPAPAPIKFEDFTLPEGVTLDKDETARFATILNETHDTKELGQKLVNFYVEQTQKDVARLSEAAQAQWAKTNEDWISTVRADPEIGGNRSETVLQTTRQLIEQFGGNADQKKAIRSMFAMTGAGNHPEMIRFLYRVGKALGEGRPVPAPTPKASPDASNLTSAQKRYGKSSPNGAAT